MISRSTPNAFPATLGFLGLYVFTTIVAPSMFSASALAEDSTIPWECSNYSGEAQTRCINALIEDQRNRIGKLEGELQSQQSQIQNLQEQANQQSRAAAPPAQSLAPAPVPYAYVSPPYGYPFGYPYAYAYPPGIGLGFYFGRPYSYGPRYWGPRYYGHWGHGHHR